MIPQLIKRFDISISPYELSGISQQISQINTEINQALQLKEKPDIQYMKDIANKHKSLIIANETVPFILKIGKRGSTLADYDFEKEVITYYWGDELKPLDFSVINHEAYHHLQMRHLCHEIATKVPGKIPMDILRKKVADFIANYREQQTAKYDARYGEGTTYNDLYFLTAKELVNYADQIARELALYMKSNRDYLIFYHIKHILSDYSRYNNELTNLGPQLQKISPLLGGLRNKISEIAKKLNLDYHRVFEKFLNRVIKQLEIYIKGQYELDSMQERILSNGGIEVYRKQLTDLDMKFEKFFSEPKNQRDTYKGFTRLYRKNKSPEITSFSHKYFVINDLVRIPIYLGVNAYKGGKLGGYAAYYPRENDFKVVLMLDYDKVVEKVFYTKDCSDTLIHECVHILQNYYLAIRKLSIENKPVTKDNIYTTMGQFQMKGASGVPDGSLPSQLKYLANKKEVEARAQSMVDFLTRKVNGYDILTAIKRNDFKTADKLLRMLRNEIQKGNPNKRAVAIPGYDEVDNTHREEINRSNGRLDYHKAISWGIKVKQFEDVKTLYIEQTDYIANNRR